MVFLSLPLYKGQIITKLTEKGGQVKMAEKWPNWWPLISTCFPSFPYYLYSIHISLILDTTKKNYRIG